jgi:CheY-like chemotaxis protein/HPt (histidine-containing phosphotransfer) domain-containing protein
MPVLIVDDNFTNRILLQEMTTSLGLVPTITANGKEALDRFNKAVASGRPYRLILLDIQMPEMDGFDAAREIRKIEDRGQEPEARGQKSEDRKQEEPLRVTSCELRVKDEKPESTEPETRHTQPATANPSTINNRQSTIERVPIIAMTAHAMTGDREKCIDAGMDDYVSKPIKPEALYSVINKVARKSRSEKEQKRTQFLQGSKTFSPKTFDLSGTMETVLGNEDLFREIAGMFIENCSDYITRIKKGIAGNDAGILEREAHSLKGAVGNFGAKEAYEVAHRFEKLGEEGEMAMAAAGLSSLESALSELASEMKIVLQEMRK